MISIADQVAETARSLSDAERAKILSALQWLTMTELCALTGYSARTLYRCIEEGMPCYRSGHGKGFSYRFDQSSIDWLRSESRRAA